MALGPNRYGMSDERGYELDEFGNPVVSTKDGRVVADSDVNPPAETRSSGGDMFGSMFAGLDMRKALRGIYSGMGAAAQANKGWGGLGRAYGAGLLGGQAPSERDRAELLKQEYWKERADYMEEKAIEAERREAEKWSGLIEERLRTMLPAPPAAAPTTASRVTDEAAAGLRGIAAGVSGGTQAKNPNWFTDLMSQLQGLGSVDPDAHEGAGVTGGIREEDDRSPEPDWSPKGPYRGGPMTGATVI